MSSTLEYYFFFAKVNVADCWRKLVNSWPFLHESWWIHEEFWRIVLKYKFIQKFIKKVFVNALLPIHGHFWPFLAHFCPILDIFFGFICVWDMFHMYIYSCTFLAISVQFLANSCHILAQFAWIHACVFVDQLFSIVAQFLAILTQFFENSTLGKL